MPWFRPWPRKRSAWVRYRPFLEVLGERLAPAIFTVNTVGDTGAGIGPTGDLRYCLTQANTTPGQDTIQFAIPGNGLHTIDLNSALPAILDPVLIDGYSQPGASANTLAAGDNAVLTIELNGAAAGAGVSGLTISAGGSTVSGLVIGNFSGDGIDLTSSGSNQVLGNFIGTDAAGTTAAANGGFGVYAASSSASNTIGGTTAAARNLISGNSSSGIRLDSTGNTVQGNFVGTDATGLQALGNQGGVNNGAISLFNTANLIGGTTAGAGNVIAGNTGVGILVYNAGPAGNTIQGNFIGLGADGATAVNNTLYGIYLALASSNTLVGGSTAAARNVIGDNGGFGIILDAGAANTTIQGNYIGTDSSGTLARPQANGIYATAPNALILDNVVSGNGFPASGAGINVVGASATGVVLQGNLVGLNAAGTAALGNGSGILVADAPGVLIGGTTAADRNVISGNSQDGIQIYQGSTGALVEGNYLGTDVTGTVALGNALDGIAVLSGSSGNTIGGTAAGAGNVISGNAHNGVQISDVNTNGNVVAGNLIGTNAAGTAALANTGDGVLVQNGAANNTVGGTATGAGNLISGNRSDGVDILDSGTTGNVVQGNTIGLAADGTTILGNSGTGLQILNASGNTIGGTAGGAGNVLSGNSGSGLGISGSASTNLVQGNFIGTNAAGTAARPNANNGVVIFNASANTIGGTAAGARNLISGNTDGGLILAGNGADANLIQGNYIGTDVTGTIDLGNGLDGIFINVGDNNTIGGTSAAARNVIGGNNRYGIQVRADATGNLVQGNFIGTDVTGTADLGNTLDGILIAAAANNTIGGSASGAGNLISGNKGTGVRISGATSTGNLVAGNRIGTNAAGTADLGNTGEGVRIEGGATSNTIGGTDSGAGNVISGNDSGGVRITGTGTTANVVAQNIIGLNATGNAAIGNSSIGGVYIDAGAAGNVIGGSTPSARNIISGNLGYGVLLNTSSGTGNFVQGNYIGTDITGLSAQGNTNDGIAIANGSGGNVIGTDGDGSGDAGEGNVISGNQQQGIEIGGANTVGNIVAGNLIGLGADGTTLLGNTIVGIQLLTGTNHNRIGTNGDGVSDALERNVISGNGLYGVQIAGDGASFNMIAGNYIGTDATGTLDRGNGTGIIIHSGAANNNTIGGTVAGMGNVISGNDATGVAIGSGPSGNVLLGNIIGLTAAGNAVLANTGAGVSISSANNVVGGTAAGARNVISGNTTDGITISTATGTGIIVQGNYIGTDVTGTLDLGNSGSGVQISAAAGNTIGGTTAGAGNVISGNNNGGVLITGASAANNLVAGNSIGLNSPGTAALGNVESGIRLVNAGSGNVIGGTTAAARNVISGNLSGSNSGAGILLSGTSSTVIIGNYIGTNAAGTAAVGNEVWGIVQIGGNNTQIGTDGNGVNDALEGNVISGNGYGGIALQSTQNVIVAGNKIGTNSAGTAAISGQGTYGGVVLLALQASDVTRFNRIGTNADGTSDDLERNLISGNNGIGVHLEGFAGATVSSNTVAGNYIGTAADGVTNLGNTTSGVLIELGATGNTIGGTAAGAGNVISGNGGSGVLLQGSGTSGNLVQGNFIGTNAAGTAALANGTDGVQITGGAANNVIGGNVAGSRNVISGNFASGVEMTGSSGNKVQGNYIGTDWTGMTALGNAAITTQSAAGVLIGGNAHDNIIGVDGDGVNDATEGNLISGNLRHGVRIQGPFNVVAGNDIGVNAAGTAALANVSSAIEVLAANTRIGTNGDGVSDALEANVISGNGNIAIDLFDSLNAGLAHDNVVAGNFIGTNRGGTLSLGNSSWGVSIRDAHDNTIGGTTLVTRNIISANLIGVVITGTGSTGNTVAGNYVGTDQTGTIAFGNTSDGMLINGGAHDNTIGGTTTAARNLISGNGGVGVDLQGPGTSGNVVAGNFIGTNAAGTAALGNTGAGVRVQGGATNNTVGGSTAGAGNVIAGNRDGIVLSDAGTTANLIAGNTIGLGSDGSTALGNTLSGVAVQLGANANTIGGTTAASRNVISANRLMGVLLDTGVRDTLVEGNYIGTDATGLLARGNAQAVGIAGNHNTIGGTAAGAGNVISGNDYGVLLESEAFDASTAVGNFVQGNYIGTDKTGNAPLGNGHYGLLLWYASDNTIGGTAAGAGNVFSGNTGPGVAAEVAYGDVIAGNTIGLGADGSTVVGNSGGGVLVQVARETVTGNVVSGNTGDGIQVLHNAVPDGVFVWFPADGTPAELAEGSPAGGVQAELLNGATYAPGKSGQAFHFDGIDDAVRYDVGGPSGGGSPVTYDAWIRTTAAGGTVIADDGFVASDSGVGLFLLNGMAVFRSSKGTAGEFNFDLTGGPAVNDGQWHHVAGTWDGLAGGTATLFVDGVPVATGAALTAIPTFPRYTHIGGNDLNAAYPHFAGEIDDPASYNAVLTPAQVAKIFSLGGGNKDDGGTVLTGNTVGLNAAGTAARANTGAGIRLIATSMNTVGGTTPGARNVISGNSADGVFLTDAGTSGNVVEGNFIGTDKDGTAALGNGGSGVLITNGATGNTVVGTTAARNIISGNAGSGVDIEGSGTTGNVVQGNFIGTDATGTAGLGNLNGVVITEASGNTIGGTTAAARNVISGNSSVGIDVLGSTTTGNLIQANYIGTDASGSRALPNVYGVQFGGTTFGNTVGGTAAGAGNVISGNTVYGVVYVNTGTAGNPTQGNIIGLAADGDTLLGNGVAGVIVSGAINNTIGGTAAGAGNVISGNPDGILVVGGSGTVIQGNYLGTDKSGTRDRGNIDGIEVDFEPPGTLIGGTAAGAGNVISGNNLGIVVQNAGPSGTLIQGNLIGTDKNGTAALANTQAGVLIRNGATGNTLGGTTAGAGNVISGNTGAGVELDTRSNAVEGNYIGTDITGNAPLGNGNGVILQGNGNTIGGTVAEARNVISGNNDAGIQINGSTGNTVAGNYIGTNAAGSAVVANAAAGVRIQQGANHNTIGGSPAQRNIISGNALQGVHIRDAGSDWNWVASNYIGTDANGTLALGNGSNDVWITLGAQHNTIGTNGDGTGDASEGNVLSASGAGVTAASGVSISDESSGLAMNSVHTAFNVVAGNFIGTDKTGTLIVDSQGHSFGNGYSGVSVYTGSNNNRIGTDGDGVSDADERNVIAGNAAHGVILQGGGVNDNVIAGNYIGTDVTGTVALGNKRGVTITALSSGAPQQNRIGVNPTDADAAAEGNIISANTTFGVWLTGTGVSQNTVAGNSIGTNAAGTVALGNTLDGVLIQSAATGNTIGGTTAVARNVISGNKADGVTITDSGTSGNLVEGNFIGTNAAGSAALANGQSGVHVLGGASNDTIGGTTAGARNIISGNAGAAIYFDGLTSGAVTSCLVQGNYIGTDVSGTHALGNASGITIANGSSITIGGTAAGAGNVISASTAFNADGIDLFNGSTNNVIQGNLIGTDATGTVAMGNPRDAILLNLSDVQNNLIGGTAPGAGNVISASGRFGVYLRFANNNTVQGNYIGTDKTGNVALGSTIGIVAASASGNLIGGTAAGAGNVISGNLNAGVFVDDYFGVNPGASANNTIQGNLVGLNAAGTAAVPNTGYGIFVAVAQNTLIGGTAPGAGNVIAGTRTYTFPPSEDVPAGVNGAGLVVEGSAPGTVVQGNRIGTDKTGSTALPNAGSGIFLYNAAAAVSGNHIAGNAGDGITLEGNDVPGGLAGLWHAENSTSDGRFFDGTLLGGATYAPGLVGQAFSFDGVNGAFQDNSALAPPGGRIQYNFGATYEGWIKTSASSGTLITDGGGIDTQTGLGLFLQGGHLVAIGSKGSAGQFNFVLTSPGTVNDGGWHHVAVTWDGTTAAGGVTLYLDGVAVASGTAQATITGASSLLYFGGDPNLALPYYKGLLDEVGAYSKALTAGEIATIFSLGGVAKTGSGSTITGNLIGTNAAGSAALANGGDGIDLLGSSFNTIGGTTAAARNVISGNTADAVVLSGSGTTANVIAGNFLGTDASGTARLGNAQDGVLIEKGATGNTIGGTVAAARNVISGNARFGIEINASANLVQGNYIGVDATGNTLLADGNGVVVQAAGNTIGGTTAGAGNVIGDGVGLGLADGTLIQGNTIGLGADGTTPLGNNNFGVYVFSSHNVVIGGVTPAARNIISGNFEFGIITNADANGLVIQGNYIGTDRTGELARPNTYYGISVSSPDVLIGGLTATPGTGPGNVISGNGSGRLSGGGIGFSGGTGGGDFVEGNIIGLDAGGTTALNDFQNLGVGSNVPNVTVGGTAAGARNVISGNGHGVEMGTAANTGDVVEGNYIGTDLSGTHAIANLNGVWITASASGNTIGGTTAGAGNLISGNAGDGVAIEGTSGNVVAGNFIGTDVSGTAALGNAGDGVHIESGATGNTVGGTAAGARNVISGNTGSGVDIQGSGTSGNLVAGNYIGTDATGTAAIANAGTAGILLSGSANNNTIGGTAPGAGNVISGNDAGVDIQGSGTGGNVVQGNLIGTDATGTHGLANRSGAAIDSAGNALIGNVVSGNMFQGIVLGGSAATNNVIAGNLIGLGKDGVTPLGNGSYGIYDTGAPGNTIGGPVAADRNVISDNGGFGILIQSAADNVIEGNYIGTDKDGTLARGNHLPGGAGIFLGASDRTTVTGNLISGNAGTGLILASSNNSRVQGNLIGVQQDGTTALANAQGGIDVSSSSHNTIGGTTAADRNIISGNAVVGIELDGSATTGNLVEGNYIGVGSDGTTAVPNTTLAGSFGYGVWLLGGAHDNTIGGTVVGAGNVISGNAGSGVDIEGSGTTGNVVAGNLIGTDQTGTVRLGNAHDGVLIETGASNNTIGGTSPGARNVISGNDTAGANFVGVYLVGSGTDGNVVAGNFIGTDVSGTAALGNTGDGVVIQFGATNNTIGGSTASARNLISGNQQGEGVAIAGASGNTIAGNFIGTDVSGTAAVPNTGGGAASGGNGILFEDASNNVIADNLISGNNGTGIFFFLASSGNVIQGNKIGTDVTGTHALPNTGGQGYGIRFFDTGVHDNTIGGTTSGAGNLISGNAAAGILISGPSNLVEGNYIGTDVTGTVALGNGQGIAVLSGSSGNTIGGTTAAARNVISGNTGNGVTISDSGTTGNVVEGNYIGTDKDGAAALANTLDGVLITGGASSNIIGGTTPGAGNVISGNASAGIELANLSAANFIEGNYIGTDATGSVALPNTGSGIVVSFADNQVIGGTDPGARNVISGNGFDGIILNGVHSIVLQGNYIGLNAAGTAALANQHSGIEVEGGTSGTVIGGSTPGAGNVISGNAVDGIVIGGASNSILGNRIGTNAAGSAAVGNAADGVALTSSATSTTVSGNVVSGNGANGVEVNGDFLGLASGNLIDGNLIGTDATGSSAVPNAGDGVLIRGGATTTTVGAPGAGNVIAGNLGNGVEISDAGSIATVVAGNLIGLTAAGLALGNVLDGVRIVSASGTTVGGTTSGSGNTIAHNRKGVVVVGSGATGNRILGNSIFANAGPGIDLGDDGVTLNNLAGHSGPNGFQSFPILTQVTSAGANNFTAFGHLDGTPNTTYRVEFFDNDAYDPTGYGPGQKYLGFVNATTDASGHTSFSFPYTSDPVLTATATDSAGNTSEFSGRDRPPVNTVPGPQTTDENIVLTFGGATALSVSDPDDDGSEPLQITLTVNHGTLTLSGLTGLIGSGNGTSNLTYTGTPADLNAALAGMTYTPTALFDGADTLTLTTSDLVAPQLGGPGTATSSVSITVAEVVQSPHLTVADTAGNEGQDIPLLIDASTVDTDGSERLSIQVSGVPAAASLSAGTADGNGVWTLTPDQLNGLTLDTTDNFTATLTVKATSTQVADGSSASTTATLTATVANVAPTATVTNSGPVDEGSPVTVSFSNQLDPSTVDTTAGFHYAYAFDGGSLAGATYANSGTASSASTTYADGPSDHTVRVRIIDQDDGFSEYTTVVHVNNVAPTATVTNSGPVDKGSPVTVSFANQHDPSSADAAAGFHYAYAFDGGSLAGATYANSGTASSASTTYADGPGDHSVRVRIIDQDDGFTEYTTVVHVNNVAPTATVANSGPVNEGSPVTVSFANQHDPSTVDTTAGFHYAYAFDGGSLAGATYANSGTASSASTTYADGPSDHTVRVRIIDQDDGFSEYLTVVHVNNVAPTAVLGNDGPIDVGASATIFFTNPSDPSPADTAAGFRYSFALNPADLAPSYAAASPDAQRGFQFDAPGTFTVYGRIFDKDGGFADYRTTVTVRAIILAPPPPVTPITPPESPSPVSAPPPVVPETPLTTTPSASLAPAAVALVVDKAVPPEESAAAGSATLQSDLGSVFQGGSYGLPSVNAAVAAAQGAVVRSTAQADRRTASGPEAQSILQATQVVAATLDGDDNVRLVEVLLERNARPVAAKAQAAGGNSVRQVVEPPAPPAEVTAGAVAADDPGPLTWLVKWAAFPATLALAATGWFWRRTRRRRKEKPAGPA